MKWRKLLALSLILAFAAAPNQGCAVARGITKGVGAVGRTATKAVGTVVKTVTRPLR